MNLNTIVKILKQSVELVYERDYYLIENDVHEQDISHRIAHYFENFLMLYPWYSENGYRIDVEYNRNFHDSKRAFSGCDGCSKQECLAKSGMHSYRDVCKPDIILHKRGKNNQTTNEYNNILAIEIKKNHSIDNEDFAKLSAFTCSKGEYKYKLGLYINLTQNKEDIVYKYFRRNKNIVGANFSHIILEVNNDD